MEHVVGLKLRRTTKLKQWDCFWNPLSITRHDWIHFSMNFIGVWNWRYVAITYRVHGFENFDENFVQGTISPLLKSHIPLDGSVSLFKYLPTELKRI